MRENQKTDVKFLLQSEELSDGSIRRQKSIFY